MMLSLSYVSSATELLDERGLDDLLGEIRPINVALGLSGLLLYCDGNIMQVLEGEAPQVHATFGRIQRDPRHRGVLLLNEELLEQRRFPDWSMGYQRVQRAELEDPEGFSRFLRSRYAQGEAEPWESDRGPALDLLRTFRETMTR